jgi:hypothetical protein
MTHLKAKELVLHAAKISKREKENYSRREIAKNINEIKYLSSKKEVPRLTLHKHIIHLENKLHGLMEVDNKLKIHKKKESIKIASLKRQITSLKKKLMMSEDKNLSKKVERLSHLMGDLLAQRDSAISIKNSKKSLKVIKRPSESILQNRKIQRIEIILNKIKQKVETIKEKHPKRAQLLIQKISLIEAKLLMYKPQEQKTIEIDTTKDQKEIQVKAQNILTTNTQQGIKHTMMITPQTQLQEPQLENIVHQESKQIEPTLDVDDSEADIMLPLPPPPRMV